MRTKESGRRCLPPFVFLNKATEKVFSDYSFSIRQSLLTSLVGVFILLSAVFAILYFVHPMTTTFDNISYVCMCGIFIVLYVFANTKYLRSRRSVLAVSYTFWIVLALLAFVSLPIQELRSSKESFSPADGVWQCLLLIYTVYLIQTVHFYLALAFGIALPAAHFAASVVVRDETARLRRETSWETLAANAVLFLAANVMGIVVHVVCDRVRRASFLSCRSYVARKAEVQEHALNLERLLHTMLPQYIASEVKANLMVAKANQARGTYARQHRQACIMSATIQGLDVLKKKLSPCDFVRVLSDLTTAFEQLCEKHRCLYIKASGDAFLAACGIPTTISSESVRCCLELAFDLIQAVNLLKQAEDANVVALVGVHIGAVVDGVVGFSTARRWRYECYGCDVLLARHLGVTGVSGKVHISEPTLQQLQTPVDAATAGGAVISSSGYDFQRSPISHGLNVPSYFVSCRTQRPLNLVHQRFLRKINSSDGPPSTPRPASAPPEGESAFSRIICRSLADDTCSLSSHKFMVSSLPEVVVPYSKRTVSSGQSSDSSSSSEHVNKLLSQAIVGGAVEQETSAHVNFFTLKFKDKQMESEFFAESRTGPARGLAALLLILVCMSAVHFVALPRTMVLLVGFLFLFMVLSLLLIAVLAMKLKIITCNAFHGSVSQSVLATLLMILLCSLSVVNVLTCKDCILAVPSYLRYGVAEAEADTDCSPPHYVYLAAILVLFGVVNFRISYILQLFLLVLVAACFGVVVAFTNVSGFQAHDKQYLNPDAPSTTPSSSVLGLVGIIHFVLLHFLVGRHIEWVHRVVFIWKYKERHESTGLKELRGCEQQVVANMLPPHIIPYYAQPTSGGGASLLPINYSSDRDFVGIAVITIPNFPNLMAEMEQVGQGVGVIQAIDEIETFLDELLQRDDFQQLERIHVCGPMYILACGVRSKDRNGSMEQCPTCRSHEQNGCSHSVDDIHSQQLTKVLEVVLDLRARLQLVNEGTGRSLFMRAGVAVGNAVEGVVGNAYPQYSIWGTAVDDARKLELTCKAGQIQVSKAVSQLMKHRFHFQQRGQAVLPAVTELSPHYLLGARLQPVASDSASMSGSTGHRQGCGSGPRRQQQQQTSGSVASPTPGGSAASDGLPVGSSCSSSGGAPVGAVHHGAPPVVGGRLRTQSADSSVASTGGGTPCGSVIRLEKKDSLCESAGAQSRRLAGAATVASAAAPPPASSLGKSRPLSPELPAVHYSKNVAAASVPSSSQLIVRDAAACGGGRSTVFLTQANLNGISIGEVGGGTPASVPTCPPASAANISVVEVVTASADPAALSNPSEALVERSSPHCADESDVMQQPAKMASIPKIANVISTSNAMQGASSRRLESAGSIGAGTSVSTGGETASVGSLHCHSAHSGTLCDDTGVFLLPPPPPDGIPEVKLQPQRLNEYPEDALSYCDEATTATAAPQHGMDDSCASLSDILKVKGREPGSISSSENSDAAHTRDSISMLSEELRLAEGEEPAPLPPPVGDWSLASGVSCRPLLSCHLPSLVTPQAAGGPNANGPLFNDARRGPAVSHARITPTRNHSNGSWRTPSVPSSPWLTPVNGGYAQQLSPPAPLSMLHRTYQGLAVDRNGCESDISDEEQHPLMRLPWTAGAPASGRDRRSASADVGYPAPSKFTSKLQRLHEAKGRQNVRDLYSELESDAADCESVVSADETDFESDAASSAAAGRQAQWWGRASGPCPPSALGSPRAMAMGGGSSRQERAEAATGATRPLTEAQGAGPLRQSCSMECLPSDTEEAAAAVASLSRRMSRHLQASSARRYLDDKGSVVSSCLGSELSRSDPYLSYDESEYDNCRPGLTSDEDFFAPNRPAVISDTDLSQLDINFDQFRLSDRARVPDYISTLERRIRARQRQNVVTDV